MIFRNRQRPTKRLLGQAGCILSTVFFYAMSANGQDGYWTESSGGSWANAGNWDSANGIAGGADNTAYFGFSREGVINSGSSFTVDGAQTIGNLFFTSQGGSGNWSFNPGSGGSITLENDLGPSVITVTSPSLEIALNVALNGSSQVEKNGTGTLVLGGANGYSGQTLVKGGALDVNGSLAGGGVDVANATLSGTGTINGAVNIGSGGNILLGNGSGPLTINNSLTLHSGSTTVVTIGASGRPVVQGLSSVTYGGTLIVNNLAGAPSLGQGFTIFGAAAASGNFSSISPPPGPWMRWEFNPATGQISVVSSASQPCFTNLFLASGKLKFQLTHGPPGSPCYLLCSTNLNLPTSSWTCLGTNAFDMSGNCAGESAPGLSGTGQSYFKAYIIPSP